MYLKRRKTADWAHFVGIEMMANICALKASKTESLWLISRDLMDLSTVFMHIRT